MYIMYAAKKYCVDRLTEECCAFLKTNLTIDNACTLLEQAHLCTEEKLAADCLSVIMDNPEKCLQSKAFSDLCQVCVCKVTDSDDLGVREEVVYEAVMRWSEAECGRQNLEITDSNRRQVLGDVFYTVRFPVMDREYFEKEVMKSDVLNPEDVFLTTKLRNNYTASLKNIKMKTSIRTIIRKIERVQRFSIFSINDWDCRGLDSISFKSSKAIYFHGIGMCGCKSGNSNYNVTIELYDSHVNRMNSKSGNIETNQNQDIYDIMFDVPCKLQSDVLYTVVANIKGNLTTAGVNGKQSINFHDVEIIFMKNQKDTSGTRVQYGQIPCLILSRH